jgi:hypothetical protein
VSRVSFVLFKDIFAIGYAILVLFCHFNWHAIRCTSLHLYFFLANYRIHALTFEEKFSKVVSGDGCPIIDLYHYYCVSFMSSGCCQLDNPILIFTEVVYLPVLLLQLPRPPQLLLSLSRELIFFHRILICNIIKYVSSFMTLYCFLLSPVGMIFTTVICTELKQKLMVRLPQTLLRGEI